MHKELRQLQPARLFYQRHAKAREAYFSPQEFWAPGREWLRDAYCAEAFAKKTSARMVGLIANTKPDFEVQYRNGRLLRFEATLADRPGRELAREERSAWNSSAMTRPDPEENWRGRRRAIPAALRAASERKSKKHYDRDTNLLIYLNLGTYDYWCDEIERELIEHTAMARSNFNSIWVLWSGRLYRTWPDPFLGNADAFRPNRHQLGWALNALESKRVLQQVFSKKQRAA